MGKYQHSHWYCLFNFVRLFRWIVAGWQSAREKENDLLLRCCLSYGCTWRALCEWSALPAFLFLIFAYHYLPESPVFLAARGRSAEAEAVLRRIEQINSFSIETDNSSLPTDGDSNNPEADSGNARPDSLSTAEFTAAVRKTVFSSYYASTTYLLLFAHFTKDFAVFGLAYVALDLSHQKSKYC